MQVIVRVSPSQLDQYLKCPRAWYLDNVAGERVADEDVPEYRKQGKRIHAIVEWYYEHGNVPTKEQFEADPKHGPGSWVEDHHAKGCRLVIHALAKGDIPEYDPANILVEAKIEEPVILNPDGTTAAWLLGYADLLWEDDATFHVDDHKTTGSFDNNKTPQQILEDTQLNCYAKHIQRTAGEDTPIQLRHVYYFTGNKFKVRTTTVVADTTPESIDQVWEGKVVPTTREIVQIRKAAPTPLEVEARGALNGHCNSYGGCRHREFCGITQVSSFAAFGKGGFAMSDTQKANPLLARLQAAGKVPTTPPPSGETPAAPLAPPPAAAPPAPAAPAPAAASPTPAADVLARLKVKGLGTPALGTALAGQVAKELGTEDPKGGLAGSGEIGKVMAHTVADLALIEAQTAGLLPQDTPPREDPAPVPAEQPMPGIPATSTPPAGRKARVAAVEVLCPACRKRLKLQADGKLPEHRGVDANFKPDKMAGCVGSGDTPEEAAAWVAKQTARHTQADLEVATVEAVAPMANPAPPSAKAQVETPHPDVDSVPMPALALKALADGAMAQSAELDARAARIAELERALGEASIVITNLEAETEELAKRTQAVAPPAGLTLFLNTYPHRGEATPVPFETWIAPIMAAAAETAELPDYQLLDYKSSALLAVTVRAHVNPDKDGVIRAPIPPALAVDTKHRAWGPASEILLPLARRIIKPNY